MFPVDIALFMKKNSLRFAKRITSSEPTLSFMTKIRQTHILPFLIIVALLALQWSNMHLHLPESHSHESIEHQHQVKVHSHRSIDRCPIDGNLSHQKGDATAIEFAEEFRYNRNGKHYTLSLATTHSPGISFSTAISEVIWPIYEAKLHDLKLSYVQPRAPPFIS